MKLYRINATLGQQTEGGYWRAQQVPFFVLEGTPHGLRTEQEAEQFAERMLVELAGPGAQASACAVDISPDRTDARAASPFIALDGALVSQDEPEPWEE